MTDFNIGYEIELGIPLLRETLILRLREELGLDVIVQSFSIRRDYTRWMIVNDVSIRVRPGFRSHEIISPVMPFEEGMAKMQILFNWLNANGAEVNSSCGFHVGLSFADPIKQAKIDASKLVYHFDEQRFAKEWKRQRNRYCEAIKPVIPQIVMGSIHNLASSGGRDFLGTLPKISQVLITSGGKFRTINFNKMPNYIEFRIMGGLKYLAKMNLIKETIEHYKDCMIKSINPEESKNEYTQFMNKIIKNAAKAGIKKAKEQKREYTNNINSYQRRIEELSASEIEFNIICELFDNV
jgi:hypothetical protein